MSVSNQWQRWTCAAAAAVLAFGLSSCDAAFTATGAGVPKELSASQPAGPQAQQIADIVARRMKEQDLTSAVYGVWRGGELIASGAVGGSPVGVPATADMQVRIGQPMEPMLSTVLLQLDGEGVLDQDEPIAKWLPDFPRAGQITPRMLASSTSGISDYVTNPNFEKQFYADPIAGFTSEQLLALANERPPLFEPGKSFAYAHSDLVVLGEVLEKATGKPLGELLQTRVLDPLGMRASKVVLTPQLNEPFLHGYTNERGVFEDSSFWNPTAFRHSGNMNTTVADVATWVRALADGKVLSKEQHQAMMAPSTAGLGSLTKDKFFAYGVAHAGDWIFMNPAYGGYHGVVYYDTVSKTLVVAYVTLGPTSDANVDNALPLGKEIATMLVPDRPPQV
ncbi:serine hydrolase domain-containing protein [Catellatospora sp. KI3]|uniref:serine hydrolase domain-containing protein n=1 Tax=Catellatospora sp. KI3 TaxID=3041620 RepID=UPI0024823ADB|nr:serine hydrolase domain-containing protein [Catellatospora sp. KI3]MDI1462886.1 serine hydrolase domain-containing protein [Catellatospora sp. KI3]